MNKLSFGQYSSLLLITDAFTLLCLMGNITAATLTGFICGAGLQLLLIILCAFFYKKGGRMTKCAQWFYLIYILIFGGILFAMLWNGAEALSVPSENFKIIPEKFLITGAIGIVCLYASSYGIKELSRAGVITAALGVICLAVMILGAASEWKWSNINLQVSSQSFIKELSRSFAISGGVGSGVLLLRYVRGDEIKYAAWYYVEKAALYLIIPLVTMAVAGGIMGITDFPVIMAAQLSQLSSSQRIDSLFLIVFAVMAVFSVALQAVCSAYLIGDLFPKFKRFRSTLSLLIMMGIAFAVTEIGQYSVIFAVLTAIVPIAVFVGKRRKAK